MKCKKLLTTLVVIAMIASTMIVFNKIADLKFEGASAAQVTPGVTHWQGNNSDDSFSTNIINKTQGSEDDVTSRLYYGNTVDIEFNGDIINQFSGNCSYFFQISIIDMIN